MPATAEHTGATGLQEDGERSPRWAFSDVIECRRTFTGTMAECLAARLYRGQIPVPPAPIYCQVPGFALYVQCWDCTITPLPGGKGRIEFYFTGSHPATGNAGGALPEPDEWIQPKQFDISLQFHPKYTAVVGGATELHQNRLEAIGTLLKMSATDPRRQSAGLKFIFDAGEADYDADVHELYLKMLRGMSHYWEEYPVLFQRVYSWTEPVGMVGAGFLEVPTLLKLTSLPSGLIWKRFADWPTFDGRRGYWTLERKWMGALEWDNLYDWAP